MSKNKKTLIAPLGLLGIAAITGTFLMSSSVFADDSVVDDVNIIVPTSCSLEGTGMTSHNANIVNGTYEANIGSTTLKAFCNDSDGFAIYAIGYTDNEYGKTVLANSVLGSTHDIATGTATSGSTSNWAMKLEAGTGTYPLTLDNGFGSYSNVPSSYTKVAHRDSGTDLGTSAEGATLTSTYAAYISKTQPADSYIGQVIYTLVHPASETPLQPLPAKAGKIVYHPNTSSVQGQMGDQDATNNASVTLWASNFKRSGYGFAGWNDKYDYSGNFYGPNQDIAAPNDVETNGLSLYAVWIKSAGSLQNWDGCDSLAQGTTTALTDERDGNTYAVAKLADGKCWMIENLRLDNTPELTSTNTHNPSLPLTNSWWYSSTNDSDTKPTSNKLSSSVNPSAAAWCHIDLSNCDDQSMLYTSNITDFTDNISSTQDGDIYSYGNYYNWYSATAGHGKYNKSSGNVEGDLCPAGWHLPTGKTSGEFGALDIALGGTGASQSSYAGKAQSAKWRTYPNNFVYSGTVYESLVYNRSYYGNYWSSSASVGGNAYSMGFNSSFVHPGGSISRYYGRMVRCVINPSNN